MDVEREYLNLGAGGECGLYTGSHWWKEAAVDDAVPMTLYIDYGDGTRCRWADWTWWITSFNPYKQDVDVNDITITGTIDLAMFQMRCGKRLRIHIIGKNHRVL